jgi:hypothetical protein
MGGDNLILKLLIAGKKILEATLGMINQYRKQTKV